MSIFFKTPLSLDVLYGLLDEICLYRDNHYVIDSTSFNKMVYMGLYEPFIEKIKENYFPQKKSRLEKEASFYNFIVLIKQICNHHDLSITSKKVYIKSVKHNVYFVELRK
jgi:hypothetical protein